MTFAVTPAGVRANIPIFQWEGKTFADLYWSAGNGSGRRGFLHLELDPDGRASSFHRLSYQVGYPRLTWIPATKYLHVRPPDGPPSWKEVLIRHRPPLRRTPGQLPDSGTLSFTPAIPMQLTFDPPVRFPEARIRQFMKQSFSSHFEIHGAGLHSPWTADHYLSTAYVFWGQPSYCIIIKVGRCPRKWEPPPRKQCQLQAVWATVIVKYYPSPPRISGAEMVSPDTIHDCSQDHVSQWPDLRKTFEVGFGYYSTKTAKVTLSFTRCPINPEGTLILDASVRTPH